MSKHIVNLHYDMVKCNFCKSVFHEGNNLLINQCLVCGSENLESPWSEVEGDIEIPKPHMEKLMKKYPGRWEILS